MVRGLTEFSGAAIVAIRPAAAPAIGFQVTTHIDGEVVGRVYFNWGIKERSNHFRVAFCINSIKAKD